MTTSTGARATDADWLFLPGTLCDGRVFDPLVDRLRPVIGTGQVRLEPGFDTSDVGHLADRAMEGLGPRVWVVGFSLGCQVAFEIMRRVPDRCAGLILISTTAQADAPEMAPVRRALVPRAQQEGADRLVEAELWSRYVATPDLAGHPAKDLVLAMARDTDPDAFAEQIEISVGRRDSRPDLEGFAGPLLMINGAEDGLTPPDMGAEIAGRAPRGQQRILPDASHFVLIEQVDRTAEVIATWIEDHVV